MKTWLYKRPDENSPILIPYEVGTLYQFPLLDIEVFVKELTFNVLSYFCPTIHFHFTEYFKTHRHALTLAFMRFYTESLNEPYQDECKDVDYFTHLVRILSKASTDIFEYMYKTEDDIVPFHELFHDKLMEILAYMEDNFQVIPEILTLDGLRWRYRIAGKLLFAEFRGDYRYLRYQTKEDDNAWVKSP